MKVEMSKKRSYKREGKLVVIEKNSVGVGMWVSNWGGDIQHDVNHQGEKFCYSHLIPILHKIKHQVRTFFSTRKKTHLNRYQIDMGMHVWKLDLNQQKNMQEGILFLFSNSPPFYPYYMYFVTNRIELDLHRNWVSRIQI